MQRNLMIAAWCLVMLSPLPALAGTYEFRLDNGMKLIVKEDHRAPVVVSQVWYRAGSIDEVSGTTGVAHLLEHMMFKGTKDVPGGQFSKIIAAAGGKENAFTGEDYTAYFQQLQASKLPVSFKLEADRMHNLVISPEEFAKEIKVVMEERRWRTDDKPQALVYEQMHAAAFESHPYHHPVIGWMNDLENMTAGDAQEWYTRWYTPNNATLVVVGDVEPQAVLKLAQESYGKIATRPLPPRKLPVEAEQRGIKRLTVKAPAQLPYLLMGYHAPALQNPDQDWEPYALDVLAGVLDGHASARLNKALVQEQQVASSVGAGYDLIARGPSMFQLDGTPVEGKTVADLEAALRVQIEKIKQDGVTEEELQRVKAQVVAGRVFQRDSMFYQAMLIGQLETTGLSYQALDTVLEKLKAVTAPQVREVARKYLVDDHLTVATLDPQPLDKVKPAMPPKGLHHAN